MTDSMGGPGDVPFPRTGDGPEANGAAPSPRQPASRHYRRAQHDRGAETRKALIAAALDSFGRYGFEAASTRDIAKRAGANLAAIVYHFGSKESLHIAVAEYVAGEMSARLAAPIEAALEASERPLAPVAARAHLQRIVDAHIDTTLGEAEAELWARFLMREQMEPSPAFELVYGVTSKVHAGSARLVGAILGLDPDSEAVQMKVFAIMGQVVIFRVGQPLLLRKLGRAALGPADRQTIRSIVSEHIDRILGVTAAA